MRAAAAHKELSPNAVSALFRLMMTCQRFGLANIHSASRSATALGKLLDTSDQEALRRSQLGKKTESIQLP